MEKSLNVTSMDEAKAKVSDVQVFGAPGAWVLLGKASSESQGWMKSTKAMQTPAGVLVQASTQQQNPDGSYAVAEALTFVPGATIRQVSGNHWEFATRAPIREALAAMKSCIQCGEPWTETMQAVYDKAMAVLPGELAARETPIYPTWSFGGWPKPPGYDEGAWAELDDRIRHNVWAMRWGCNSMSMKEAPDDAELRRYVGEVMAGGPGFDGAPKQ
jgi:hypothetical protein